MSESEFVETVLHAEVPVAGTRTVAVGRARLQRVVVHERRTIEVDVAHEEYRVVQDDLDPSESDAIAADGPRSASVVLHEERIEIVRHVVAVERVTLRTERVAGEREVEVTLRRETAEFDHQPAVV